ncbi:ribosome maturation factor RimM [Thalassobacillus devorans]|uniref:ribosome maturation factor RimM n=1 Tax=Thalassobacillus devorans TaxID=279813 RepID=UPI00048EFB3F|nr:ribosome maturation factor RimM [Thalassobacillus devorans]
MEQQMYNVGKVINTHGIKGEVKVMRITDFDERFQPGEPLYWMKDGGKPEKLIVSGHRNHKGFDLLTFEGLPTINDVEHLKGGILQIREEQLSDLEEGEFYFHEIIGCRVILEDGTELGKVKEILTPGANDVWVVEREGKPDALIPYIEDVVKKVDLEEERIVIDPIEGLLD